MTNTANLKAEIEVLNERIVDLEIDLSRLTSLFGHSINEVTETVAAIRTLKAKEGDVSVNALLAKALRNNPNLKIARDAIDAELFRHVNGFANGDITPSGPVEVKRVDIDEVYVKASRLSLWRKFIRANNNRSNQQ